MSFDVTWRNRDAGMVDFRPPAPWQSLRFATRGGAWAFRDRLVSEFPDVFVFIRNRETNKQTNKQTALPF